MGEKVAANDLLERVREFICDDLQQAERVFYEELECGHPYVIDVLSQITRFRGKRLRPILLLLTARACGEVNQDHAVLAAVVEMIHVATLVHDDVLDAAETRRHVATVNTRWNNETSVLFGDYLFTHAFHLASSLESTRACRLIGRATNVVCVGEMSQIHERGNLDLAEAEYLQIIEGKTAELCAVCCRLGAEFANADEQTVEALEQYGRNLGIAFQIADDLLDVFGDEKQIGKSLGTDLAQQKLTLPLIRLLDQCDESDGARIRELLERADEDSWCELVSYLKQSDAVLYAQQRANQFAADARQYLHHLPDSPAKQILEEMADFASQRSF